MSYKVKIADPGKFFVLLAAIVCGCAVIITAMVTHDGGGLAVGAGIVTTALGYLTGNGRLARKGQSPQPTLSPKRRREDMDE